MIITNIILYDIIDNNSIAEFKKIVKTNVHYELSYKNLLLDTLLNPYYIPYIEYFLLNNKKIGIDFINTGLFPFIHLKCIMNNIDYIVYIRMMVKLHKKYKKHIKGKDSFNAFKLINSLKTKKIRIIADYFLSYCIYDLNGFVKEYVKSKKKIRPNKNTSMSLTNFVIINTPEYINAVTDNNFYMKRIKKIMKTYK